MIDKRWIRGELRKEIAAVESIRKGSIRNELGERRRNGKMPVCERESKEGVAAGLSLSAWAQSEG